ncbi:WS/DGAT/MGAT family O-acyltransferase [Pseudonocardia sp. GCM10023141]|uniref:WS/DGAT/MGAT family O-acyltransferase n=1 Tax=Pseudonocardia sp. GCM10023141 TaxID=3252653 RepID=UPI0036244CE3
MDQMSLLDASFLYMENDTTPMHIGGVAVFEGPPASHDELITRFAAKMPLVPRYRQKVQFLPLDIGRPAWVDDPHFNLEYHLRRTAVPAPGGRAELDNLVARVMSQHLDRARPLWEVWVVEGLEDDQWAIVSKVHHCMVDGVAATDLMSVLFDLEQDPAPLPAAPPWRPRPAPTPLDVLGGTLSGVVSPADRVWKLLGSLRDPRGFAGSGVETIRAFAGMAPHLVPPKDATSLNGAYGPHRRWTSAHSSLADIKAIRAALGGTINDVVLTAITRGFRDVLIGRGENTPSRTIRTMVPVSVRAEHEKGAYNNKVSSVFADLPVGLDDPAARLAAIRASMDGIKKSKGAVAGARLAELGDFAPPMLLAAGQRRAATMAQTSFHTVTTNVPGPQRPLYFAGRVLLQSAPIIPLGASIRTAIGIFSYNGGVHFGITGDYDTVPDIDVLARGIEAGVAELLEIARAAGAAADSASVPAKGVRA